MSLFVPIFSRLQCDSHPQVFYESVFLSISLSVLMSYSVEPHYPQNSGPTAKENEVSQIFCFTESNLARPMPLTWALVAPPVGMWCLAMTYVSSELGDFFIFQDVPCFRVKDTVHSFKNISLCFQQDLFRKDLKRYFVFIQAQNNIKLRNGWKPFSLPHMWNFQRSPKLPSKTHWCATLKHFHNAFKWFIVLRFPTCLGRDIGAVAGERVSFSSLTLKAFLALPFWHGTEGRPHKMFSPTEQK